jgi:hypothetical protein
MKPDISVLQEEFRDVERGLIIIVLVLVLVLIFTFQIGRAHV